MSNETSLAVVRQAAESKPDDPIYRLVLASLKEGGYFSATDKAAIERCAREIEAAE